MPLLLLAVVGGGLYRRQHTKVNTVVKVKETPVAHVVKAVIVDTNSNAMWQTLNTSVTNLIATRPDLQIGMSVIDISSGTQANYGIQNSFEGASTTKVLSAVVLLHQVEQGKLKLNSPLGDYTAQYQLKQMINQSNNDAWAAINTRVGHGALEAYAKSIGMNSFNTNRNLINASDDALLLSNLYQGKLLNESNTKLLLGYMQHTNFESMIPTVIPSGATIYHKYGQLEDRLHDTAIVNYQERPLVLTIYTKSVSGKDADYTARTTFIKQLAKAVFTTFYNV